jgi:hypothetical protein
MCCNSARAASLFGHICPGVSSLQHDLRPDLRVDSATPYWEKTTEAEIKDLSARGAARFFLLCRRNGFNSPVSGAARCSDIDEIAAAVKILTGERHTAAITENRGLAEFCSLLIESVGIHNVLQM